MDRTNVLTAQGEWNIRFGSALAASAIAGFLVSFEFWGGALTFLLIALGFWGLLWLKDSKSKTK